MSRRRKRKKGRLLLPLIIMLAFYALNLDSQEVLEPAPEIKSFEASVEDIVRSNIAVETTIPPISEEVVDKPEEDPEKCLDNDLYSEHIDVNSEIYEIIAEDFCKKETDPIDPVDVDSIIENDTPAVAVPDTPPANSPVADYLPYGNNSRNDFNKIIPEEFDPYEPIDV